jgi:hypothetical protein
MLYGERRNIAVIPFARRSFSIRTLRLTPSRVGGTHIDEAAAQTRTTRIVPLSKVLRYSSSCSGGFWWAG